MLKYLILIVTQVFLSSFGFAAGKTEKEESCNWGCKLPYYICLEKGFDMSDKEKIRQLCSIQSQEYDDPRDCILDNSKKLSKENRYETLRNRCKSDKSKCVNGCLAR